MKLQVLRLSSAWEKTMAPLQAWVSRVVQEVNSLQAVRLVTVTYVEGVSPDPFPVKEAGRPRAMWLGRIVEKADPDNPVTPVMSWANAKDGAVFTFSGLLNTGGEYTITLCVVD